MQTDRFRRPTDPALAIFIMRTDDGSHTGLLVRMNGLLMNQDVLWHEKFRSSPCRQLPHFVTPALEPEEIHDVRMMCQLIHERQNSRDPSKEYRIPYAFRYTNKARINRATGEVQLVDGLGMSCSTFVLAVFQSVEIRLVDMATWKARADDITRHEQLLQKMRDGIPDFADPAPPAHIALVARETTCLRVRPEEVAATGMINDLPATFEQLETAGTWIMSEIRWCPVRLVERPASFYAVSSGPSPFPRGSDLGETSWTT